MESLQDQLELEPETQTDDEELTISYDIATYPSDHTLAGITKMWEDGDIVVPEFQREFVWSIKQSSLLIDSFLCGLPVPPVFFYIDEENRNLVIDGQQRIMSVVFYFEGFFGRESTHGKRQVFRLRGLTEQSPYHNKKFSELSASDQRKLKNSVLRAINIKQLSPAGESTSAYHIFERLNTGGTPLTPQEIRSCVFMGELCNQLKLANRDSNWRVILGRKVIDRHQKDIEILLRVFALVGEVEKYEKPMKEFLNRAMKAHQSGTSQKSKKFFEIFPKITKMIVEHLGEKPFHIRGPLNASALESVMCVLFEEFAKIKADRLERNYDSLLKDQKFADYTQIGTTDTKTIQDRVKLVRKHLTR